MNTPTTVLIERCLVRLRDGDPSARDELFACACDRLRRLTRKMLRHYPGVHRWEDTGDVMQNAVIRLCRALDAVRPPTARDFYRLAAVQVRRELIDLARHYFGPQGLGARHGSQPPPGDSSAPPPFEPSAPSADPGRLAAWADFHEQAAALPEDEREVFDLLWYQGLTRGEAATLIGVSERTVKSRWRAARLQIADALGGQMPGD